MDATFTAKDIYEVYDEGGLDTVAMFRNIQDARMFARRKKGATLIIYSHRTERKLFRYDKGVESKI